MAKRGPRSERGKAIVALNAVRHGILSREVVVAPTERREDFDEVLSSLIADLQPEGALEYHLVEIIAESLWRRRRLLRHESGKIAAGQDTVDMEVRGRGGPLAATDSLGELEGKLDGARALLDVLVRTRDQDSPDNEYGTEVAPDSAVEAIKMIAGAESPSIYSSVEGLPPFEARLKFTGWTTRLVSRVADELARRREAIGEVVGDGTISYPIVFGWDLLDRAAELTACSVGKLEHEISEVEALRDKRAVPETTDVTALARYEAQVMNQFYKALHELEAQQARRRGEAAPLARLQFHGPE